MLIYYGDFESFVMFEYNVCFIYIGVILDN